MTDMKKTTIPVVHAAAYQRLLDIAASADPAEGIGSGGRCVDRRQNRRQAEANDVPFYCG